MTTYRPAEVFPPGEFLKDELAARGWTQGDLAEVIGRPVGLVNEIIKGKRGISAETANGLAAAFSTSPELWMNLEATYQLSKLGPEQSTTSISRRAQLYSLAPIKEMIRRGWIEGAEDVSELERQLLDFFCIKSIEEEPPIVAHAARKSTSYAESLTPSQRAWLMRAQQLAASVHAESFTQAKLRHAISELRGLLSEPEELRRVPRVLSDAGVKLVIIQPLSGSKIDGACFWAGDNPVVALSLRYDRIDHIWFVLMHELGHVSLGKKRTPVVDIDLDSGASSQDKADVEKRADSFAAENLIPSECIQSFIDRTRPLYSSRKIDAFAFRIGVHPGIVVGQLQHKEEIPYKHFRNKLVPVRERLLGASLTDGWGWTISSAS